MSRPLKDRSSPAGLTRTNSLDKQRKPPSSTLFSRPSFKSRLASNAPSDAPVGSVLNNNANNMSSTTPSSPHGGDPLTPPGLMKQNQELRQRLQDEACNYRRRLDTYKQAQQNQAALVGRLQNKVLQYKQRCNDLEGKIHDTLPLTPRTTSSGAIPSLPPCSNNNYSTSAGNSHQPTVPLDPLPSSREYRMDDPEEVVRRLEDEKHRCEQLISHNQMLRQQLEESHRTNEALSVDLQKLTADWEQMRDDMMAKEEEWKEEEQAFNEYYNSEHNRSLNMWRDVVAVKRLFKDMQISVKSEMSRMQSHIISAGRDVAGACGGLSVAQRQSQQSEEAAHLLAERANGDLRQQIAELRGQYGETRHELQERDHRLQSLLGDLKILEDRCAQAENQAVQVNRLADEIERLNAALRDIAHVVVQDADVTVDVDSAGQHMHLSQSGGTGSLVGVPPRSPKRGGVRTSQAFAEGTISAVQASLHKYQLLLHNMQVKLQTSSEALHATKKQCDTTEQSRDILAAKLSELTDKLDASNMQLSELCKERETLQKTLDGMRSEKQAVERSKAELSAVLDSVNGDYERLQGANSKLQKALDATEEEKKFGDLELQRVLKDKELTEMSLRAEEERGSRMREETITLREELNKLYLVRDMLEQQRMESDGMMSLMEKQKMELEFDLDRLSGERADLINQLESSASSNDNVSFEVKTLSATIAEVEAERNTLKAQSADQATDIAALKKELISAEQTRLDLESVRLSLNEKIKCMEIEKEKVEQELSHVVRERSDLSNQLTATTRKKEQICEEMSRIRQRLEQSNEMNNRLNRNMEDLVKEGEEKVVIIEANEKELQRLQEVLASQRAEKEALEATLFDTNTTLEATENRRDQLERDVQELLVKQESLKNTVARLNKDLENSERRAQETKIQLTNAASAQEAEFRQKIAQLKQMDEDNVRKLNEEKEQIRAALEKRMAQALHAMESCKDAEFEGLRERYETLQLHLDSVCQQHEEIMIRAENEKQQALLLAQRDKQAVMEKLELVVRELNKEQEHIERLRREAAARTDKDRGAINQLKDEAARLKQKAESEKVRLEEQISKLEIGLNSTKTERDSAQSDVEALKVQLRMAEDKGDGINAQLQETMRKLKENDIATESIRKELTDTRRGLADSNIERDKYANTNKELRDHVKRSEGQRREQARNIEEAMQKIANLEESRNTADVEKARLSTTLKETQNNLTKLTNEHAAAQSSIAKMQQNSGQKDVAEKELQARLCNETEERERVQLELNQVKKQMADLDATLHATRQDLGRARCKANQDEHRWHAREQELLGRMEEGRVREKRLEDQKHNLEVCLADATQQIQELKARLGGAEGRVRALDDQLAATECSRKDAETRLSSVGHTLRRIAGIQMDGSVSQPYRLLSPSRRFSPARGAHDFERGSVSGDCNVMLEVDPEMVRKGVRTLMQQVAHIERERDDYKAQLCTAKKQHQEVSEQFNRSENKVSKLQQTLRATQEDKANTEAKLAQKESALNNVEEQLQAKMAEANGLRERVNGLELQLGTSNEERAQCEDRLEKTRHNVARLESEKRHIQEELARCESRATKLDVQRVTLEGDIQRLQMALQERDNHVRNVQERLDNQTRASTQLEDRCVALKTTVDQLKERLQTSAITETELRGELNCLQKERTEQGHNVLAAEDKMKQMQKAVATSENERRILAERMEATQAVVQDLRRSQQSQQDQIQRQQEQVAEIEVQKAALESQLRISKWNQDNQDQLGGGSVAEEDLNRQLLNTQREKAELKGKMEALAEKVRHLENEKNVTGGSKFSGHVQFDRSEKSLYGGAEYDSNRMETESVMSRRDGGRDRVSGGSTFNCGLDHSVIEQENRDLRMKVRRLETLIAEKESELARAKAKVFDNPKCLPGGDVERYRSAQMQAERLLDAREQSHRQQVLRLENQISMLREQLAQEAKRRQMYILRSSRTGREMQQLRHTLGDSLRHVAQDPLDSGLLENEARRLDCAVSMSLPPNSGRDYGDRSLSPRSTYK